MGRVGVIAAVVLMWGASSAQATTIAVEDGSPDWPYQEWVDSSRVPGPDGVVTVEERFCGEYGAAGCTEPGTWWVAVDSSGMEPVVRRGFLHELGHQFDYHSFTDEGRAAFASLIWRPGEPWRTEPHTSLHEVFAESYSLCARGRTVHGKWRWPGRNGRFHDKERLAPFVTGGQQIGPRRFSHVCELITST